MGRVCVFCGSATGNRPIYRQAAAEMGAALARNQIGLVYGGGHIGLMGVLADAVLSAGGEVAGVIPQSLVDRELAHGGLTQLHVVGSMHERKALMADLADGFVALPGAFGTADELFEILTWSQLGLHAKPVGLLNVARYFSSLLGWLDHAVAEGFLQTPHRNLLMAADSAEELLERMRSRPPRSATPRARGGTP